MSKENIEIVENTDELVEHILGCAMADTIDMISALMCSAGRGIGDRVFCYCNMSSPTAYVGTFYTEHEKAFLMSKVMDTDAHSELTVGIMGLLNYLKEKYNEFAPKKMPAELFLDFDPYDYERKYHGFVGMEKFTDNYDATVRFASWFKEHGGDPGPIPPRERTFSNAFKFRFMGLRGELVENPTGSCEAIDFAALAEHQQYFAGLE